MRAKWKYTKDESIWFSSGELALVLPEYVGKYNHDKQENAMKETNTEKKKGGRHWINMEQRKRIVCKRETVNWRVCEGFRWKHDEKVRSEKIEDLPGATR